MEYFETLGSGIRIRHPDGCFRMSTDSMLAADFLPLGPRDRVADLGCGSGNLAFLLAGREPEVRITGFELQTAAVQAAQSNVTENGLADRITIVQADLRRIREITPPGRFDAAVSNPPYFPVGSGRAAASEAMHLARSEKVCSLRELCQAAAWLVRTGGSFTLVHKPERLCDLVWELRQAGLEPKRLRLVRHHAEAAVSLALLDSRRGGRPGLHIDPDFILFDAAGQPTADYRRAYHMA